jgi:hypothetical protein
MQVIINKPVSVEVKFPLYFRAGASAYAVFSEEQAVVAHWWESLNRGFINSMTAEEALREYQPGAEITADEYRAAAKHTFNHIESMYQQSIQP